MYRAISRSFLAVLAVLTLAAAAAQAQIAEEKPTAPAWLGLFIRDLDRDDARALDLGENVVGVVVSGVDDEGPAGHAGIEPGDVISQLDGQPVTDQGAFVAALQARRPGDRVRLTVVRDTTTRTYDIELESHPGSAASSPPAPATPEPETQNRFDRSPRRGLRPRLGVEIMDLDDADLAAYFGVPAGGGVLVRRVTERSGAARAGMKAGDVIVRIGGRDVQNSHELLQVLASYSTGDEVDVLVRRSKHEHKLRVELDGGPDLGIAPFGNMPLLPRFDADLERLKREVRDLRRQMQDLQNELRQRERR